MKYPEYLHPSAALSGLSDTNSGGNIAELVPIPRENAEFTRRFAEKPLKLLTLFLLFLVIGFTPAMANNIAVSNSKVVFNNETSAFIEFDLSWENSWRVTDLGHGVGNWDAAWVFVKFREGGGVWQHAWLSTEDNDHDPGSGTGATINIGTTNIGGTDRGMGAFIYRSGSGTGTFSITDARLQWNFADQGVAGLSPIQIRVFAIEMVYVAEGAFAAGSGGSDTWEFTLTTINTATANTPPSGTGSLGGQAGGYPTGHTAPNAAWPNGFSAFYMMKYSITQQQYVDFLNTLTSTQAGKRAYTGREFRNQIRVSGGVYSTTNPYVANNYMSWMDGAAYMDWSGLRPMTELEYEKAARGLANPVAYEYAWGTDQITNEVYTLSSLNAANEGIASNYNTSGTAGNAWYSSVIGSMRGPLRVGIFAAHGSNSGRVTSGASYWGIMELSGNVAERAVTVEYVSGRSFTGLHGNGELNNAGDADVDHWPGINGNNHLGTPNGVYNGTIGVTHAAGSGTRGGSFFDTAERNRVSNRVIAMSMDASRFNRPGFRGVRSAPAAGGGD